jgi:hypothetical protein
MPQSFCVRRASPVFLTADAIAGAPPSSGGRVSAGLMAPVLGTQFPVLCYRKVSGAYFRQSSGHAYRALQSSSLLAE